jgi:hypothetical protein
MGLELLACRATVAGGPVPGVDANTLCLVDGNHRVIGLALEDRLPPTCAMLFGSAPVPIDTTVLNPVAPPSLR